MFRGKRLLKRSDMGLRLFPVRQQDSIYCQFICKELCKTCQDLFWILKKKVLKLLKYFPLKSIMKQNPYDKIERFFIDKPLKFINKLTDLFVFLQNGQLQRYILYGIIFITAVFCVPLIIDKIIINSSFFK